MQDMEDRFFSDIKIAYIHLLYFFMKSLSINRSYIYHKSTYFLHLN